MDIWIPVAVWQAVMDYQRGKRAAMRDLPVDRDKLVTLADNIADAVFACGVSEGDRADEGDGNGCDAGIMLGRADGQRVGHELRGPMVRCLLPLGHAVAHLGVRPDGMAILRFAEEPDEEEDENEVSE